LDSEAKNCARLAKSESHVSFSEISGWWRSVGFSPGVLRKYTSV
jgi:hypothetical protein